MFRSKLLWAVLWLVPVGLFAWALIQVGILQISVTTPADVNAQTAYEKCSQSVISQTEVPAAAQVPKYDEHSPDIRVTGNSPGPYSVYSYIDAQDATGTVGRHHYPCQITFKTNGDADVLWIVND
jgi:hypothetical protein